MGGLRSLKRSIAKHPERVWLAKQNEKKQKQIALENDAKKKAEAEKLVAEVTEKLAAESIAAQNNRNLQKQ